MVYRKVLGALLLLAASLVGAASANAKVFYVSGSSNRTSGGSSCSDALSVAWFNSQYSWGTASHQISPGTTVYLCGAFNGSAGQQLLWVRGSGTSSAPITIKFLSGAVLSAPYWSGNGAIHMDYVSYVIIDGGGVGIIQNTANGTGRSYRAQSVGIHAAQCQHCTVRNLTIQNLYVRTSSSDLSATHSVNCVYWHLANYMTVDHITCHDASWAIAGDGNNFTLSNSDIYHVDHGVASGPIGKNGGYSIHNNHFHDFANWDSSTNTYHHDGIHLWGQNGGTVTGGAIYSNTFDGDFGANVTAHVFLQDSVQHVAVYNNITNAPTTRTINSIWVSATSTSLPGGSAMYNSVNNNSINAGGHRAGAGIYADNQLYFTAVNNIMGGGVSDVTLARSTSLSSTGVNNNVYRDLFAEFGDRNTFSYKGTYTYAISTWRSRCRCDGASKLILSSSTTAFSSVNLADSTSSTADPAAADSVNLAVVNQPMTSDPEFQLLNAVGQGNGMNLTDLAGSSEELAGINLDMNGNPRPTAGPWNVGPF
jgi:hypothetical protein